MVSRLMEAFARDIVRLFGTDQVRNPQHMSQNAPETDPNAPSRATGPCPICRAPRAAWPMAHRGNRACSQHCESALELQETPHLNPIDDSSFSVNPEPVKPLDVSADVSSVCPGCEEAWGGNPFATLYRLSGRVWHKKCIEEMDLLS